MRGLLTLCAFAVVMAVNDEVAAKSSGVEPFWVEDYKAFQNLYSRTSDKDLYRRSVLPTARPYSSDDTLTIPKQKHIDKQVEEFGDLFDSDDSPYKDRYIRLLAEQTLKSFDKTKQKPGTKYFTDSYFKPINKKNNKDLYNYLERLEAYETKKRGNYKHQEKFNEDKTKHALLYGSHARIRCGRNGCKRPSKISLINGPYVKRIKHRIVHY